MFQSFYVYVSVYVWGGGAEAGEDGEKRQIDQKD